MRCTLDSVDPARPSSPVGSRSMNSAKLMVLVIECAAEISMRCHWVDCLLRATAKADTSVILSLEISYKGCLRAIRSTTILPRD